MKNGYKNVDIKVTAPDGKTAKTYSLIVRPYIDAKNPYQTLNVGKHTQSVTLNDGTTRNFTAYVPEGARESCAGVFVLPDKNGGKFNVWKNLADKTDTQAIDETWTKQQEKFIVIYLDGLTYDNMENDIDYVNKVYDAASRPFAVLHSRGEKLSGRLRRRRYDRADGGNGSDGCVGRPDHS